MRNWTAAVIVFCLIAQAGCASKKSPESKPAPKATQRPYSVNGKRYEPIPSAVGFTQRGIASWYGRDFHGKRTSNGEEYDMHAMTAAHKTLPLGVYVKVENIENGKETIVRVNDRGPFVKDRILDLSLAAAKKLGMDVIGTAPIRIEALGYRVAGSEEYRPLPDYDSGLYSVQVGAFKAETNAVRLAGELRRMYGYAEVRTADVRGERFHRVYVGKFKSLRAAEFSEQEFIGRGYSGSFAVALD